MDVFCFDPRWRVNAWARWWSFLLRTCRLSRRSTFHALLSIAFLFSQNAKAEPAQPFAIQVQFETTQYFIHPGETFPVRVMVTPPPEGLASFGVRVSFAPENASPSGAADIQVNQQLAFDGPRADSPVVAAGNNFVAAKGTLRFVSGEAVPLQGNQTKPVLVTFLIHDLGKGAYPLHLDFFNTLGPTEQIFVSGTGAVLDSRLSFGSAEVIPSGGLEIDASGPLALNRQTGLFEQTIRIINKRISPVSGAVIGLPGLPAGWQVWNASGTNGGIPFLRVSTPIAAGASLPVRVEYLVPNRNPQQRPIYSIIDFDPGPPSNPSGPFFVISPRASLPDGSFLLEFSSISDRSYSIQYSRDLTNWITVSPPALGNGSRLQWIDYGPPKTDLPPLKDTNRFYRVFLLP